MADAPGPAGPPLVAIVVAAFNAADYLEQTLASVQAQTLTGWHCVVVDDGSADATGQIAAAFAARDPRFTLHRQGNAGVSAARNAGLALAPPTPWVAFLDSDDLWLPDALERLCSLARRRPDAVGVYGLAEYMDEDGAPVHPGVHPEVQRDRRRPSRLDLTGVPPQDDGTFDSLVVSGTIWPPGVGLFDRATVTAVGGFDPEQRAAEDWDLFLRMSRRGPFVPLDRQVAWYRQHAANATRAEEFMAFFYARVRWKAWASPDNTAAQRRVVRHVWLRLQLRVVSWAALAAMRAARSRDLSTARAAAAATCVFLGELLAGRPRPPTRRSASYVARFVAGRRTNRSALTAPPA